ncbi:hypothetical protein WOLCODRAFT_137295 [Wolfiporia cocos MD-104 SS10]|uniref:Uncharacterized protein n=1 Tax=Wolfiporia cocos (strain MD-104) TaxID=742152 RepID=A0A2H3JX30_WOLCO|nr:hypothetical protein WOLCODRAFT_137295 [Wolfiporia cocos MD-104 SS10]
MTWIRLQVTDPWLSTSPWFASSFLAYRTPRGDQCERTHHRLSGQAFNREERERSALWLLHAADAVDQCEDQIHISTFTSNKAVRL